MQKSNEEIRLIQNNIIKYLPSVVYIYSIFNSLNICIVCMYEHAIYSQNIHYINFKYFEHTDYITN